MITITKASNSCFEKSFFFPTTFGNFYRYRLFFNVYSWSLPRLDGEKNGRFQIFSPLFNLNRNFFGQIFPPFFLLFPFLFSSFFFPMAIFSIFFRGGLFWTIYIPVKHVCQCFASHRKAAILTKGWLMWIYISQQQVLTN